MTSLIRTTLICLFVLAASNQSTFATDQPHPGPLSDAEANLLFFDGKAHLEAGRFTQAASTLQRMVDRYPRNSLSDTALLYLGEAYLKNKNPNRALDPLRRFVKKNPHQDDGNQARLLLIQAYIKLNLMSDRRSRSRSPRVLRPLRSLREDRGRVSAFSDRP